MFGPFDARIDDRPLPPFRSRKGQWLLALLVLRHGSELSRSWLSGVLWPDSSDAQALASLRQSLSNLRSVLGPHGVRLRAPTPSTIAFDVKGVDIDVVRFDDRITENTQSGLAEAVKLYRGPLLEGCAEEWVIRERDTREQSYLAALESLAFAANGKGDMSSATAYERAIIATDPYRESAYAGLMQALAANGDVVAATLVYRDLRSLLHEELNAEPAPETTAVYNQIRQSAKRRTRTGRSERERHEDSTRSKSGVGRRLPKPLTALIGRKRVLEEITARLSATRLATLAGPTGIGKTRLGIQVAEEAIEEYPDGAAFIDFGDATDLDSATRTLAAAVGVRGTPERTSLADVIDHLRSRSALLVFNDCERVVNACAELARAVLESCPNARILATTQQPLNLIGESVFRIAGLTFPPETVLPNDESAGPILMQYESVRLFVERASTSAPFALGPRNARAVASICRKLEGVPLAIELAAGRTNVLSVEQIEAKLDDRFDLLVGGNRTAAPRHQSLRAATEWSFGLLSPTERTLLARLTIFSGGATLEAVEAVCAGSGIRRERILDLLSQLTDRSLTTVSEVAGEAHYRLLGAVRSYGREILGSGNETLDLHRAHRDYFLALAEESAPHIEGDAEQAPWLRRMSAAQDDVRRAFDDLLAAPVDPSRDDDAMRMAAGLWRFIHLRGFVTEGRRRLALTLARGQDLTALRAAVLGGAGVLAQDQGDVAAARLNLEASVEIYRRVGDQSALAIGVGRLGALSEYEGFLATAQWSFEESLRMARELGAAPLIASAMNGLGSVAYWQGDYATAQALHDSALQAREEIGSPTATARTLASLGDVALARVDSEQARALYVRSLREYRDLRVPRGVARCLVGMASVQMAVGQTRADVERSIRLISAAARMRELIGIVPSANERADIDRKLSILRSSLDTRSFTIVWRQGASLSQNQAVTFALEAAG